MSTPAIAFLERNKVAFSVARYRHDEKGAAFAAKAIGFPLEKTVKTLVVDLGGKNFRLVLVPGDRQMALKRVAAFFSVKRAAMAEQETAERLTGYRVGGISPFGVKKRLRAVMDESLMAFGTVAINAGRRGMMLMMAPADIVAALGCDVAGIAEPAEVDHDKI